MAFAPMKMPANENVRCLMVPDVFVVEQKLGVA